MAYELNGRSSPKSTITRVNQESVHFHSHVGIAHGTFFLPPSLPQPSDPSLYGWDERSLQFSRMHPQSSQSARYAASPQMASQDISLLSSSHASTYQGATIATGNTPKHDRDGSACSTECQLSASVKPDIGMNNTLSESEQIYAPSFKKSRSNTFIAPKVVAKTFNSEIGSLVAVANTQLQQGNNVTGNNSLRCNFRRQLSGSKIEGFLSGGGDQEAMDVDTESNKPRSMSF